MENISLNNGQNAIIGSNRDIIEVIEITCGYELASLVLSKIEDAEVEKIYAKERAATDAEAYLASLESVESCLRDILEIAEGISEYIEESKRINKEEIYKRVNDIIRQIGNEL